VKKALLILIVIVIFCKYPMYCQNYGNTWVFGDSVGLSFNSGIPSVLTQPVLSSHESCSSISDSSGNLLFYVGSPTNFVIPSYWSHLVWDQNHQIMPNGDSLLGMSSITQGSVIVPFVNNQNYFYIFHIGVISGVGRYLYYSVVDMSANGGTGDVILKNVQLPIANNNSIGEKMLAVKHGNGRDWWLIVHDFDTSFCTFLISPAGISLPTYQNIGTALSLGRSVGQIQISPDGTKIVVAGDNVIDLFNFERCSGVFSNWVYLGDTLYPATGRGYYGCSFSPNSQVLYVSNVDTLFQYNINAANIRNSKITIFNDTCPLFCHIGQHLLGPDNKIYLANASGYGFGNTIYDNFNMSISFIENPNMLGLSCNFSYLGQYLNGKRSFFGLPNVPLFNMGPIQGSICDSLTSTNETYEHALNYSIIPNPNDGNFRINYLLSRNQIGIFEITDIDGKHIYELVLHQNNTIQYVSLPKLANGVYITGLTSEGHRTCQKLVIIND
jgi:hypothetical protein